MSDYGHPMGGKQGTGEAEPVRSPELSEAIRQLSPNPPQPVGEETRDGVSLDPERWTEYGCAYALGQLTKEVRPAVRKAYKAPSHEERRRLLAEAAQHAHRLHRLLVYLRDGRA